jgi:hypothetical protein
MPKKGNLPFGKKLSPSEMMQPDPDPKSSSKTNSGTPEKVKDSSGNVSMPHKSSRGVQGASD